MKTKTGIEEFLPLTYTPAKRLRSSHPRLMDTYLGAEVTDCKNEMTICVCAPRLDATQWDEMAAHIVDSVNVRPLLADALRVLAVFAAKPPAAHEPAEWAASRAVVARAKEGGLL